MTERTPAEQLAEMVGRDAANAAIKAGWQAIKDVNRAQPADPIVHSGVADYVATVVILAALPALGMADPRHVIEFREDGWTLQHPLKCRRELFDCPVNRVGEGLPVPPPSALGRFACELDGDRLVIGERIDVS